ncbi:winged helix-turn-helix transcriptional regulator [Pseudonocardia sp. GCM10023141]|uniref:winged helix-turn-helix transcriptional regulator n=1 Tax=Pseudonocardia sp. GCM10023141 TaxID=3252653 RepID=UPI003608BE62
MALPREYAQQACSMARTLEVVGERWSLLIVRDAFFGVRRFNDFSGHLAVPRAVLTERLAFLVAEGVLDRVPGPGRRFEYELTDKGLALWPVVRALAYWGDTFYSPHGARRVFEHAGCGGAVNRGGRCVACGAAVAVAATTMRPGPGFEQLREDADPISVVLAQPRLLLEPVHA